MRRLCQVRRDDGERLPGSVRVSRRSLVVPLLLDQGQAAAGSRDGDQRRPRRPPPLRAASHIPDRRCLRRYWLPGRLRVLHIRTQYEQLFF